MNIYQCQEIWNNQNHGKLVDSSGLYNLTFVDNTTSAQRCIFIYFSAFDQVFIGAMFESFDMNTYNTHKCAFSNASSLCHVSEDQSNYIDFRWSYSRLIAYYNTISDPYMFVSCNGQTTIGNSYSDGNDHILLYFNDSFVTKNYLNHVCFDTKSINMRNKGCTNTKEAIYQRGGGIHWHLGEYWRQYCPNYNTECTYGSDSVYENNFGYYTASNPENQCSENDTATTNYFIGILVNYTTNDPTTHPTDNPTLFPSYLNIIYLQCKRRKKNIYSL